MLYQRATGCSLQASATLLAQQMWSMIGGDNIKLSRSQGGTQRITVGLSLHRRIPLYPCTQPRIIGVGKPEEVYTHLCRYLLSCQRGVAEQGHFTGGGEMQHMQTGTIFVGKVNRLDRGPLTGHHDANGRMVLNWNISSKFFPKSILIITVNLLRLAMCGDKRIDFGKYPLQCLVVIHQHVPCRGPHKYLYAAD